MFISSSDGINSIKPSPNDGLALINKFLFFFLQQQNPQFETAPSVK